MSTLLFSNNAATTLAGAITSTGLSAALSAGSGVEFPSPGAGQYFLATFVDAATGLLNEIVKVTARSGDTVTIVRAQEGTTALAWEAGDFFSNLWTAGSASTMLQTGQSPLGNFAIAAGTNTYTGTWNLSQSSYAQGNPQGLVYFANANTSTTVTFDDGTGPKSIVRQNGSTPQVGDIVGYLDIFDDGSNWRLLDLVASDINATVTNSTVIQAAPRAIVPFLTSTTWTCPANVNRVRARLWGGGGGGGGAYYGTGFAAAPGGGGSEYREGVFSVAAGTVYTITIGAGGSSGVGSSSPTAGGSGGATSFDAFCVAQPGGGAASALSGIQSGGLGPGGTGGSGGTIALAGAGGGSAYTIGSIPAGGIGGQSSFGGGSNSLNLASAGAPGRFPGGGANGGSSNTASTGTNGGSGGGGYMILEY